MNVQVVVYLEKESFLGFGKSFFDRCEKIAHFMCFLVEVCGLATFYKFLINLDLFIYFTRSSLPNTLSLSLFPLSSHISISLFFQKYNNIHCLFITCLNLFIVFFYLILLMLNYKTY